MEFGADINLQTQIVITFVIPWIIFHSHPQVNNFSYPVIYPNFYWLYLH